jgi:YidC/Oxa1 family membrane protein insertase
VDFFAFPPLTALLDAASRALLALADLLHPTAGSGAAACAIVLTTLVVRALLLPAGIAQAKAEQTRARLAPRLRLIQQRHRADPERLRRETVRLYRDEDASPFAGCLPLLVQAPVVGVLYAVFLHPIVGGHPNPLLAQTILGVPLGDSLVGELAAGSLDAAGIAVFGGIMLLIAGAGEVTRRCFRPTVDARAALGPAAGALGLLQFVSAIVAAFVPLAAGVYLAVTVLWTLGQRLVLRRRFPLQSGPRDTAAGG